jgi:hypothetical protein
MGLLWIFGVLGKVENRIDIVVLSISIVVLC